VATVKKITMKNGKHPDWIKGKISLGKKVQETDNVLSGLSLNTVCVSAACPNMGECWAKRHATFMILGKNCTRACKFCNVSKKNPEKLDNREPERVAKAVKKLDLDYAVVTSVTRDDLKDKGTDQFVKTVNLIKKTTPHVPVELLIPDMSADEKLLERIALSGADVIGHNLEIPEKMYTEIRPGSDYKRSLKAISLIKNFSKNTPVKSAMIIGLGETKKDILCSMMDLSKAGVDIFYIGQYLSPTRFHWPVKKYYTPDEFKTIGRIAADMGFRAVCSGPMVRSSYKARETFESLC